MTKTPLLFGIENPLLDISAVVKPELLEKYGLKSNDAILAGDEHKELFKELVRDYPVQYIAGGAAQNSCRGAQWLLPPNSTVYVGAVGKDENANKLREVAAKDGLLTEYMVDDTLPTGLCAVLITNNDRSMVTDLLAANAYKIEHLKTPKIWSLVEKSTCFYVGGYFLTVSPPSAMLIAEHALENGKPFTLNLSAPFIPQFFKDPLMELLPFTDVLFGNETEALSFAQSLNLETQDLKEIALKVSELPKRNTLVKRIVVFTQGSKETIVATCGKITCYPIIPLPKERIVDTTGAGDAFTGGFLSQYLLNEPIDKCVAAGNYVACQVIQRDGPSYPNEPHSFKF